MLQLSSSRRMLTPGEQARHQTYFHSHREPVPRVSLKCKEFFTIFIDSCSSSLLFIPKLACSDRSQPEVRVFHFRAVGLSPLSSHQTLRPTCFIFHILKRPSVSWHVNPHLPQYFRGGVEWFLYNTAEDGTSWFGAFAHISVPGVV